MPLELIALLLGLLTGVLAVAPAWVFSLLGKRKDSWFHGRSFEGSAITLGFSLVWMCSAILICYLVAFGLLVWFALPAICAMLVMFVASAVKMMRENR